MKCVIILLGKKERYLGFKQFEYIEDADAFVGSIEDLMLANIKGELPLKERIKLAPRYFPFAGRVESCEFIEIK